MRCSSVRVVPMSRRAGTLSSSRGSAVSSDAQRIGRAAFLAPEMTTSPCSGRPPWISSLSIVLGGFVFGRRQGAHRQGMDFRAHAFAQRLVDSLVAGQRALALEDGADDQGLEVGAVAVDFKVFAGQVVGDVLADVVGGGRHGSAPEFVA